MNEAEEEEHLLLTMSIDMASPLAHTALSAYPERLFALPSRKIVMIDGPDARKFLQGFTTNTMERFSDNNVHSLYTHMLAANVSITIELM